MRTMKWIVFLAILATSHGAIGAEYDVGSCLLCPPEEDGTSNLASRGLACQELACQATESRTFVENLYAGQSSFSLVGAVLNGVQVWNNAAAPQGLYDTLMATILRKTPVGVCYAPGTPPEVMAAFDRYQHIDPGPLAFFLSGRWSGAQGSPRALTWSFVPDGLFIPSAGSFDQSGNSELFSRMNTLFSGDTQAWISLFQQSFDRWEALTGTSYTRITMPGQEWDDGATWGWGGTSTRGNVRIAMRNIDGGSSVLAFNFFPSNGDMVLDRNESWNSGSNNFRFLRDVVMHEHGHGIGMFHVCSNNSQQLMEPFINTTFDGPQHDDLRGAQRHYGDPFEPDNDAGSALFLGTVTMTTPLSTPSIPSPNISNSASMSIDATGEQDWFQFTVNDPASILTVSVTPRGFTYDSSSQNPDSSCSCCNNVNSLAIADLNVELYDSDGVTLLATGASENAGQIETISDFDITGPADYFVRVFSGNSISVPQFYDVDLSIVLPGACCLADGSCTLTRAAGCATQPGFYQGDGTSCPPNPACVPVDVLMTCELASTSADPGGTVQINLFVEEVVDLQTYQAVIQITNTSGSGTLTVPCPDGARVNEAICITGDTFEPTGNACDDGVCPDASPPNICIPRPDYVFANMSTLLGESCATMELAASALGGSANVLGERKYLGDFQIDISPDTEPGSTFDITIVANQTISFLRDSLALPIPTQFGPACTVTISDLTAIDKNRYLSFKTEEPGDVAYKLDMVSSLFHPTAIVSGWVGVPDANGIAFLEPSPVTRTWTESIVNITGCEITPVAEFELRASTDDGQTFLPPLVLRTALRPGSGKWWGDTVGSFDGVQWTPPQGVTNIDDAVAVIKSFQVADGAPEVPRTDVDPQEPNLVVNINDALIVLLAFKGGTYPFGCPDDPCQDNTAVPCP